MATRRTASLAANRRRRRIAQDLVAYKDLIANPEDLGSLTSGSESGELFLPANARLAVSLDDVTAAGDIVVAGRSIVGGVAGRLFSLGYFERGPITVTRGGQARGGELTLHVLDEWGHARAIATATFA